MDKKALIKALRDTAQSASNTIASGVSAPVDLIAAGLRKMGVPVPENALGGSRWMEDVGLTVPVQEGIPKTVGETFGMIFPMAATAKAPQIAAGANRAIENAMAPATLNTPGFAGQRGAVYMPSGELSNNLDDALSYAQKLESLGYKANIEQAQGGSVYVTAMKPNFTKSGALSKRDPYSIVTGPNSVPFKARFADHPSFWGNTVSSDPFSGNTTDDLVRYFQDYTTGLNPAPLPYARFSPGALVGTIEEYEKTLRPSLSGKSIVEKIETNSRPFSFVGDSLIRKNGLMGIK